MQNLGDQFSVIPKLFVQIKARCKKGPSLFAWQLVPFQLCWRWRSEVTKQRREWQKSVITEDLEARVGSAQFLQERVRDGVKLEKVVLQTKWLLLSGRDELSEEDVQVPVWARPPVSPPHLPPPPDWGWDLPDTRNTGDTRRTSMNKGVGMLLEVTFLQLLPPSTAPACLLQYLSPAHPSPLIKGTLLDLLRVLSSVVVELGSTSKPSSIFSCAMSVPKLSLELSRFSGSRSYKHKSKWGADVGREEKGGKEKKGGSS